MDISRQVFTRSARMGIGYIILGLFMGTALTIGLNVGAIAGPVPVRGGGTVDLSSVLSGLITPVSALVGLVITTPVYLLFVSDKNAGVLEYLLAVGMGQKDIFWGYLKAAVMLSLIAIVPMVIVNLAFRAAGLGASALSGGLALVTGVADVSLVTVLMTGFSSMQRRPTGMNSPLGITIGVIALLPEFLLITIVRSDIVWIELGIAVILAAASAFLLLSLGRLIKREKLLP